MEPSMKKLIILIAVACSATRSIAFQNQTPLQLKFAVIVTRHGVRSPTWTAERLNQYSADPWPEWNVPPGNLTPRGRELMRLIGEFYRQYFVAEKLIGKSGCEDTRRTYFWADTDQRTMETGRALAEAILRACTAEVHSMPAGKVDPLFDPIEAGFAKPDPELARAAVAGRIGPELDAIVDANRAAFDILGRILNGTGKARLSVFEQPTSLNVGRNGATMNGPLSIASTFTENLLLEYANGMDGQQFGWGRLSASDLQHIMTLHTAYADLMRRTTYLARARGSNLLFHVLRSIEQAVDGKSINGAIAPLGNVLLVISGHDTNISNLSGTLGLSWLVPTHQQDDVPPGAALIFSLWHEPNTNKHYVSVQFAAQTLAQMHEATPLSLGNPPAVADLFVSGCSRAQKGFACEWSAFKRTVDGAIDPAFVH
jgi:4-phytase/acid phosphatase